MENYLQVILHTFFTGEVTDEYLELVKDSQMYNALFPKCNNLKNKLYM